jgi:phi13 family phage major tail protein
MPQIGLKYFVAAPLNEGGTGYDAGMVISHAVNANLTINNSSTPFWADDRILYTVNEFTDGTLELNGDHFSYAARALLLGHTLTGVSGSEVMTANINDEGKTVGVGFTSATIVDGAKKYRALWIKRVKFAETGETFATKSGNITYQTPTIRGSIASDDEGIWYDETLTDTEAKAMAWLNDKAKIVSAPSVPLNFTATPDDAKAVLSWAAPANTGGAAITGYQVSSDNGTTWVSADSDTGHTFTGLTNGQAYTFKVRAQNSAGSGAAATTTATPLAGV